MGKAHAFAEAFAALAAVTDGWQPSLALRSPGRSPGGVAGLSRSVCGSVAVPLILARLMGGRAIDRVVW